MINWFSGGPMREFPETFAGNLRKRRFLSTGVAKLVEYQLWATLWQEPE